MSIQNLTINNFVNGINATSTNVPALNANEVVLQDNIVSNQTVAYPTDPLTAAEINAVTAAIKAAKPDLFPENVIDNAIFLQVLLKEPVKADVINFTNGALKRKARALFYDNHNNNTWEAIASLKEPNGMGAIIVSGSLTIVKLTDTMYPNNNLDNFPIDDPIGGAQTYPYFTRAELTQLVLDNVPLMASLAARNVTEPMIYADDSNDYNGIFPYAFYTFESFRAMTGTSVTLEDVIPANAPNHRYMPAGFFKLSAVPLGITIETANWGFVEGIFIIIDCNTKSIYKVVESKLPNGQRTDIQNPAIPTSVSDPYEPIPHAILKPISTTMPDGPSFIIDEEKDIHAVEWDNWKFHWSYQRSGVSIYNVTYNDIVPGSDVSGQIAHAKSPTRIRRDVMYKNAASDTAVIYNGAYPLIERNYVSADSHNWPILPRLTTLVPGRDVPAYAKLFPVVVSSGTGEARTIDGAVAIYEEESQIGWRVNQGVIDILGWPNLDVPLTGCRKRQLVVKSIFSGFYYLFAYSYIFNQDGSMECYCDLYGQTTNQWISRQPGPITKFNLPLNGDPEDLLNMDVRGTLISKQSLAMNHTHSCVFRMDFRVDGEKNVFVQNDGAVVSMSDPLNPAGQTIRYTETAFNTERATSHDMSKNRSWEIINPKQKNRLNHPRGYELVGLCPNGNSTSLANNNSQAHLHLPYFKNHVHVTKYRPDQEYAAGEFPVLNNKVVGMGTYVNGESLSTTNGEDLVVWYNAMYAHHPHTEDYPFISAHRLGLGLYPSNFFGMNAQCSLEQETTLIHDVDGLLIGDSGAPANFTYNRQDVNKNGYS
jgi:primary-amine oxidase